ncbi:MAG: PAS domain S-box protein [Elusimicrobiota bacterium]|nr:PAS domain S-box protein [Elusimicrobiota bacterium]
MTAGKNTKMEAAKSPGDAGTTASPEISESETRYRTLFDQARDSILLMELNPAGIPVIRDANAAALRMHGYSREELLGKPISFLDQDAPESSIKKRVGRIQAAKGAVFEVRHRRKDGSTFDMEVSVGEMAVGGKHLLLEISRDITGRRKAEADSRETYEMQGLLNAMLRRSLANVPLRDKLNSHLAALVAGPWLSVEAKGAVFLTAPYGRELILTAHLGLPPHLLSACAKVPFGRCLCGQAAATGQVVTRGSVGPDHHITCEGIKPHGHYCTPIMAEGKLLGVLHLYLKEGGVLTESQKQFVKAAADVIAGNIIHSQVEEKFSQSQKMEAVGLLAGGIAHDFNNILTARKCYTGFIAKKFAPGDSRLADAKEVIAASDRASALTHQLLAFSRRQLMAPRVVDINGLMGGMTRMLKRIISEDIKLAVKLHPAPCPANVDPGQIEQVIMNLVLNARDAMVGGGIITLKTEIIRPPEEFFTARPDLPMGPLVCLSIGDTGTGMNEEVKGRIFEPFFTTKEQGKGTGLGLATVFGIVKQSHGEIEVESEPGKGSVFTVYLPFTETPLQDKDKVEDTPVKGHETVLFVEDEESLRRLGERVLRSGGYTVLVAADGQAALKLMEERDKPVDLLMTDVVMPGMSGRELALELARRKLIGRTIYMSGYTDDAIVKHGVLEPGIAFIYKPFTVEAVLLKLREVLAAPADKAKA